MAKLFATNCLLELPSTFSTPLSSSVWSYSNSVSRRYHKTPDWRKCICRILSTARLDTHSTVTLKHNICNN